MAREVPLGPTKGATNTEEEAEAALAVLVEQGKEVAVHVELSRQGSQLSLSWLNVWLSS